MAFPQPLRTQSGGAAAEAGVSVTQTTSPSGQALRRAQLFWEQSNQDIRAAKDKLKRAPLESAYLSVQAALNALTVVSYLNGKFQLPNFSTARMAAEAAGVDSRFETLREACEALEAVQHRSPFEADPDPVALADLGKTSFDHGRHVIDSVRGYLKEHQKRFFSP